MSGFHSILRMALGALLVLASVQMSHAQPYRNWVDTTLPSPAVPKMLGADTTFVFSAYALEFSHDYPIANMWTYASVMNIDNYLYRIYNDAFDLYGSSRYDSLLRSAPAGKHVIPWLGYGDDSHPNHLTEASRAREVLFFPFDSSQLRLVPDFAPVRRSKEWMFSQYQYDSLKLNTFVEIDESIPLEAWYEPSSANTIVASGIAFAFEADRHIYRWDSVIKNGLWWPTFVDPSYDSLVHSDDLFADKDYGWEKVVIDTTGGKNDTSIVLQGQYLFEHRSPHYIVVKGHLFENGPASDSDPLLRIKVYYDVDKGRTFRDSSGAYLVADTNIRFLYKSIDILKEDLSPNTSPLNWNAYREVIKEINFQNNRPDTNSPGMGGPTDTMITAQKIDIEVEYLGGERVALHAVGIRDSIANLLLGTGQKSDDYYDLIDTELMSVGRADNYVVDSAFLTIDVTDEPPLVEFVGYRMLNERLNNYFSHPFLDSLNGMHGASAPHLQHLAFSNWIQTLSYFGGTSLDGVVQYHTPSNRVPDIPEHNGGRFHIPVLFELDSLSKPHYIDTARQRIEDMNETFQVFLLGAADPEPYTDPFDLRYYFGVTRVQNHSSPAMAGGVQHVLAGTEAGGHFRYGPNAPHASGR